MEKKQKRLLIRQIGKLVVKCCHLLVNMQRYSFVKADLSTLKKQVSIYIIMA